MIMYFCDRCGSEIPDGQAFNMDIKINPPVFDKKNNAAYSSARMLFCEKCALDLTKAVYGKVNVSD